MQRKIIYLTLFLFVAVACSDSNITRINKNPLLPTQGDPRRVITYALVSYSNAITARLGIQINHVVHHTSSTGISPAGGVVAPNLPADLWVALYNGPLGNLRELEMEALQAGPTRDNVRIVTKTLTALMFLDLTCVFGDIPFTEALDPQKYTHPKFDSQEKVLDGVVAMLDEVYDIFNTLPPLNERINLAGAELLLSGNMDLWLRFANSIKIRALMLIRNVDARKKDAEAKLLVALNNSITTSIELRYPGREGSINPYRHLLTSFEGGDNESKQFYGPSPTLVKMLRDNNDPRIKVWLKDLSGTGTYPTADYGQRPTAAQTVYSNDFIREDYPDVIMTPGEIDFYRAELSLAGVLQGNPQTYFETGVRKTLQYWGGGIPGFKGTKIAETDIDAYIALLGGVDLKKIHEQLWLESIFRPVVAWNTVRRTGVPDLQPPPGSTLSTILKRYPIPADELQLNPNAMSANTTPSALFGLDTPMWFENKNN